MLEEDLKQIMKSEYDISVVSSKSMVRIMFHNNYHMIDNKNKEYFVKYYSEGYRFEEVSKLGNIYSWLQQKNIRTYKVVRNHRSGECYFKILDGIYIVFEYINGRAIESFDIGKVANALHDFHMIRQPCNIQMNSSLMRLNNVRSIWLKIDNYTFGKFPEFIKEYRELIDGLIYQNYTINNVIIHGDFNWKNILIDNEEVYFIDFDEIRIGDPREDLASMVYSLLYNNNEITFKRSKEITEFLDGYYDGNIKESDIDAIENVLRLNSLIYLIDRAELFDYLVHHRSTRYFMNSLLTIISSKNFIKKILR